MEKFDVTVTIYREDEDGTLHRQPVSPTGPDGITVVQMYTLGVAQRFAALLVDAGRDAADQREWRKAIVPEVGDGGA